VQEFAVKVKITGQKEWVSDQLADFKTSHSIDVKSDDLDDPYEGVPVEELKHIIHFWKQSNQSNYENWKEANYELCKFKNLIPSIDEDGKHRCKYCGEMITGIDENCEKAPSKLPPELSKPEPLFKTTDGKDMFIGDRVYYSRNWEVDSWVIESKDDIAHDCSTFSTRDKAIDFIVRNKPCISAQEAIDIWKEDSYFPKEINKLAQTKVKL